MAAHMISRKEQQKKVLKASLLNPKNLFVLAIGLASGAFSPMLIPIGFMAYGILCYLDISSEEFATKVLKLPTRVSKAAEEMRPLSDQQKAQTLETEELQRLRSHLLVSKEKICHQYEDTDHFTQRLLGDFSQIENLVERGEAFLFKAQTIRNYLASEDREKIQQDIASLQEKIRSVHDDFSQRQYQQALETRHTHLETLQDIQRMYERLVSQVTNIWMSLDSIYSRMMKLKTSEYSPANAESDQVSSQLTQLLEDAEQLDTALNEHLALSE